MDPGLRRVTTLPLRELWDQSGTREARAVRDDLTENDIRQLLRRGPVQFVEIMMSERPNWIPLDERFEFLEGTFATEADAVGVGGAHLHRRVPGLHRLRMGDCPGNNAHCRCDVARLRGTSAAPVRGNAPRRLGRPVRRIVAPVG